MTPEEAMDLVQMAAEKLQEDGRTGLGLGLLNAVQVLIKLPDRKKQDPRRFEAAKAAMQGMLANPFTIERYSQSVIEDSVIYADRLLAELDKTTK